MPVYMDLGNVPEQMAEASSQCPQLWLNSPLWEHSKSEVSFPVQPTLSSTMFPVPGPKYPAQGALYAKDQVCTLLLLHEQLNIILPSPSPS